MSSKPSSCAGTQIGPSHIYEAFRLLCLTMPSLKFSLSFSISLPHRLKPTKTAGRVQSEVKDSKYVANHINWMRLTALITLKNFKSRLKQVRFFLTFTLVFMLFLKLFFYNWFFLYWKNTRELLSKTHIIYFQFHMYCYGYRSWYRERWKNSLPFFSWISANVKLKRKRNLLNLLISLCISWAFTQIKYHLYFFEIKALIARSWKWI